MTSGPTIVLTNDDGIDAPGIAALQRALAGWQTAVVAPQGPMSGCSHQLNRGGPLKFGGRGHHRYAVDGTPADCTRVALSYLYPEASWVISGINAGGNLGADIYVSGTVAAVREATLLRVPGIAISHFIRKGRAIDWDAATHLAADVLATLLAQPPQPGWFWNVNLPHLAPDDPPPQLVHCSVCTQPLPTEFRVEGGQFYYTGEYGQRQGDQGSDVETCFAGQVAITQIRLW